MFAGKSVFAILLQCLDPNPENHYDNQGFNNLATYLPYLVTNLSNLSNLYVPNQAAPVSLTQPHISLT